MKKSQVPSGATKKTKCKCGLYFFPKLIGSKMKLSDACSICKPEQYKEEKK